MTKKCRCVPFKQNHLRQRLCIFWEWFIYSPTFFLFCAWWLAKNWLILACKYKPCAVLPFNDDSGDEVEETEEEEKALGKGRCVAADTNVRMRLQRQSIKWHQRHGCCSRSFWNAPLNHIPLSYFRYVIFNGTSHVAWADALLTGDHHWQLSTDWIMVF